MSRRRRTECPTPSKRAFLDVDEARAAYDADTHDGRARTWHHVPRFAYLCVCRRWHRTSSRTPGSVDLSVPA